MLEFDRHSPESYLVFDLTFPFIKLDLNGNSLVNSEIEAYKCAEIIIDKLKMEFYKNGHDIPEYFEKAHLIIVSKLYVNDKK